MPESYRVCSRCVMDTSAGGINFDDDGTCNFCTDFLQKSPHLLSETDFEIDTKRKLFLEQVKADGIGKQYDCIVGVSGGVDSSWALHLVREAGLRPLAVHMDNGWNSELAVANIKNLVTKLEVDLFTYVIDWSEYRGLMQAFFEADVIDVELLYDNAMLAVNYQQANKYNLKYILSGSNNATEGMAIPSNWNWFKYDKRNIKNILKTFGSGQTIKSFPAIGTMDFIYYKIIKKINWINFLDYYNYVKNDALDYLEENYGYQRYPYKHYESVFTRFYQGYLLPKKFNVDKRKVHLSTLVMSGQMTREEALLDLQELPYPNPQDCDDDLEYFLKKMGWSHDGLDAYIQRAAKSHADYGTEKKRWDFALGTFKQLKQVVSRIKHKK